MSEIFHHDGQSAAVHAIWSHHKEKRMLIVSSSSLNSISHQLWKDSFPQEPV